MAGALDFTRFLIGDTLRNFVKKRITKVVK